MLGHALLCRGRADASRWIVGEIKSPGPAPLVLAHVNTHNLRVITEVPGLAAILETRAACLLEGIGLKTACLLTNGFGPEDTNGTDVFPAVMDRLADATCRMFLLGATRNVVEKAAAKITRSWPNVEIVGCRHGFFSEGEFSGIVDEVRRAKPDLLLVGTGSPRQEILALEFAKAPNLSVKVIWTVGGLFDHLSGRTPRAPRWVRFLRLEFLFRIWLEPRRLAPRYLRDALWLAKRCANAWYERLLSPAP